MKQTIWLLIIMLSVFTSCKRQVIPADDVELGKDYFPLTIGHFIEYDVDSLLFNDFTKTVDTFHFEL
ncbi:MAG TPA: hypothetical protein PLZ98_03315, partial [Chitinophagaceae bacterium]|nr:hypothetical protein [Chitinophagaceae bacterium]